jgi:3-hydroxyacyl-CoA dehydrogenase
MPYSRIGVLGAGTMGSRIAAHFANAGIPSTLLDLTPELARAGIEKAAKGRPGAFFTPAAQSLITPGGFDQNLSALAKADWIIEAVAENLEIKRALLEKVAAVRRPGSVLSTNTSGIPLAQIAAGFDPEFRRNFLGTHFFNPPRYLHLVEVIPGPETSPEVLAAVSQFCDLRLGKGVVPCKDTPNFIANRIGSFFGATIHKLTVEDDLTIEEVDALTGPLIGIPKSASYRLLDIVGLDIWAHVTRNLYTAVPHDPWRERFVLPPFMERMLERGWIGDKKGQGFYQKRGKEIYALDRKTLEYHLAQKVRFPSVDAARNVEDLAERLRMLVASPDRAGTFLWKLLRDVFLYSASMIPEISDRVVEIDRAMRWGYANKLGPFELWDALGVEAAVRRMEQEKAEIPGNIARMLSSGAKSFYRPLEARTQYFDFGKNAHQTLEERPGILVLADIKRSRGVVKKNAGASLIDAGDGVLCLEFHSKMNAIGEDMVNMISAGIEETARNFEAMIVANQGDNFCVGANLMIVLLAAQEGEWDELNAAVRRFQQACWR